MRRTTLVVSLLLATTWLWPERARAAVFAVASGDVDGLVAAIDAANANGEADTIQLAAGTYQLTAAQVPATGLPTITSDIAIVGQGAASTEIRATSGLRHLLVDPAGRLRLEDLTLSGGEVLGTLGGAIYSLGDLALVDCTVSGNSGDPAGAIFQFATDGQALTIDGSTITSNGGSYAVLVSGPFVLRDSTVESNSGWGLRFDRGQQINSGQGRIEDSTIVGNGAGGVLFGIEPKVAGVLEIARSTIDANATGLEIDASAGSSAYAIVTDSTVSNNLAQGVELNGGNVVVRRSTISGNASSGSGGGISVHRPSYDAAVDLTVEQSTISGNASALDGGGIFVAAPVGPAIGTVRIHSSTITGNHADADADGSGSGGGIANGGAIVELADSIVAGNTGGVGNPPDCSGDLTSQGHNLIGATGGCALVTATGDLTNVAAKLGPLAANGGPTATHLPLPGSPAIDAADPARCAAIDQRSLARPVDGDGDAIAACDIGSTEAGSAQVVVPLSDTFLCQAAATSPGATPPPYVLGVDLADDIEDKESWVLKPAALCTPADHDERAAADPATHLDARLIHDAPGAPRHVPQIGLTLVNELGAVTVDTVKADRLLVPAATDQTTFLPPPEPSAHDVDRYKCYKTKPSHAAPKAPSAADAPHVVVADAFTAGRVLTLGKVTHVCSSVDESGLGRKNPAAYLACYLARTVKPLLAGDSEATIRDLHVSSEWGDHELDVKRSYELCVPSRRRP
jgi:hypothetical protein